MAFKLAREAEKSWRRIDGYQLIVKLPSGVRFEDGVEAEAAQERVRKDALSCLYEPLAL